MSSQKSFAGTMFMESVRREITAHSPMIDRIGWTMFASTTSVDVAALQTDAGMTM